jgi:hypothetical protein
VLIGRLTLGLVAAVRVAFFFGDPSTLSQRPLRWPAWPRRRPARDLGQSGDAVAKNQLRGPAATGTITAPWPGSA